MLLRHSGTHRWLQYKMNGRSHVLAGSGIVEGLPDDASWEVAGVADLGGDGKGDLVLRHATSGKWHYYPMNGSAVAAGSGPISLPTGSAWKLAGLGDLNGDGHDDALLRNTSGTWHWYPLDGRTRLTGDAATDLSTSTDWAFAGFGDLNGDGKDDVVLRDVSTNTTNQGRWMVRAMNGATSISAQSGVATGLTKVAAWDVAARDDPAGVPCTVPVWSCTSGQTKPGKPTIGWMNTAFSIIEVHGKVAYEELYTVHDFAQVPVAWSKSGGAVADSVRYLLNDEVFLEAALTGSSASQSGSATLQVTQGGQYDLQVAACDGTCCTKSDKKAIVVADTDGSHTDPIVWVPKVDASRNRPSTNRTTAYPNPEGSMVGVYYVEWSGYGRDYDVHNIPAHNLTHIYYGFIPICSATENDSLRSISGSHTALVNACKGRQDYKVAIHDSWGALGEVLGRPGFTNSTPYKGNYGQLMQLKKAHPDIIILPSVGGWTLSDPFYSFSDAQRRKRFVDSLEEFLQVWKFYDGVDIDWEFPGGFGANLLLGDPVVDRQTYHLLMKELREMLDRMEIRTGEKYHLTSAVSAGTDKIARVDYNAVQKYMDHILVMTYDFYGGWSTNVLGNMTGLFAPSWNPSDNYNAHTGVQAMLAQGVDPSKVALGVSMYGRGWRGVSGWTGTDHLSGTATGVYPPAKDKSKGIWEPGTQDYWGISVNEKAARDPNTTTTWTYQWDDSAKAAYLYRPGTHDIISYDNADSVRHKGAYVRSKGLAGLFAWEIDGDTGDIVNAMHDGLGHGTAVANRAPIANAGRGPHRQLRRDGRASTARLSYDLDGDALTYSWAKTSGTAVTLTGSSGERPSFTAPTVTANESLVFTLTVSDGTATATDTVTITVRSSAANRTPTANAGADQTVQTTLARTTVSLDGTGSTDPDNDTLTYLWSQTVGDTVTLSGTTVAQPQFTVDQVTADTTLTFQLQVSDGLATATDTVTITLQPASANRAPVVTLNASVWVTEGGSLSITATASDPDGDTLSYSWNTGTITGATGTDTATVSFTAPQVTADTDYTLSVTVTDDDASPLSTTANVVVTVADSSSSARAAPSIRTPRTTRRGSRRRTTSGATGSRTRAWCGRRGWWTTEEPVIGVTSWPSAWTLVSTSVEIPWHPARTYVKGDEANYGARRYRATQWTKNNIPSASSALWTDIGASTCAANGAPTANAGDDQSVDGGDTVTLDGSASTDPDTGDTLTYNWAQTSGTPTVTLTGSSTATPTFTAPRTSAGSTLVFTLTVRDGVASHTDTVTVQVAAATNQVPSANAGADQSVTSGASVTLDGTGSSDADGDPLTYSWRQTSGTPAVTLTGASTASPTFTAPTVTASTSLVFTLTVHDGTVSRSDTVTITVSPPVALDPDAGPGPDGEAGGERDPRRLGEHLLGHRHPEL